MSWCNTNDLISYDGNKLVEVIDFFVFHCPASVQSRVNDGSRLNGKKKRKTIYKDVSARNCSFQKRGISGSLLLAILAEIRRPVAKSGLYQVIKADVDVAATANSLLQNRTGRDQWPDLIVFRARPDMQKQRII